MDSIGFKNFRRFANFPSIDLKNVTILVGGNNSGKSTIVKALLLCVDNLRLMSMNDRRRNESDSPILFSLPVFRFDANAYHDAKVKTFKRAIHNKPVETLNLETLKEEKKFPTTITFEFEMGGFGFTFEVAGNPDDKDSTTGDVLSIVIEDKMAQVRYSVFYNSRMMTYEVLNPDGQRKESLIKKLARSYRNTKADLEKAKESGDLDSIVDLQQKYDKIIAQVAALSDNEGEEVEDIDEDRIIDIFEDIYKRNKPVKASYDMPLSISRNEVAEPVVLNILSNIINFATVELVPPKEDPNDDPGIHSADVVTYQILQANQEAIKLDLDRIRQSKEDLADVLNSFEIEYISAHAAHQDTIYKNDDADYLAKVVHEFYRHRIVKGEVEYEFVKHWMSKFGIGIDFDVTSYDGEAYRVDITEEDGTTVPLGDKGMGSIQMMILLLRLATIMRYRKRYQLPTIIAIEEPEQNLHPKMQSLLADMFEEITRYNNWRFVIETHSEYIIRRAQVIVAESNYIDEEDLREHNPFKIYYLPEDGSDRYEMKFKTSGRFENSFGEGFFDVAGKANLITLRKERSGK